MRISVIVPVYNGEATLPLCLRALRESTCSDWELIVVDDGSTDRSAAIAKEFNALVIPTGGPFGPARARNLGAQAATGDVLLFVDADVAVRPNALSLVAAAFESDPSLDAVIGSYDDSPTDPGLLSQFKNLQHAWVHHSGNPRATTFWCGCGAVKRSVYELHRGLDESYRRPAIEDIELGLRMFRAGRKLTLDPRIQGTHLKAWSLPNWIYTDIFLRGVPWTELILKTRFLPDDLNLGRSQRICVAAVAIAILATLLGIFQLLSAASSAAVVAVCFALIPALNRGFYQFLAQRRGLLFAIASMPLHFVYYFSCGFSFLLGAASYGSGLLFAGKPYSDAQPEAE